MEKKGHLPLFGVGPIYVAVVIALTLVAIGGTKLALLPVFSMESLQIPLTVVGVLLMVFAIYLWHAAAIQSRVHKNIMNNRLVTTGVYGMVRNPIYSACMIGCTGLLLLVNNLYLLILPVLFWAFMTILMKNTEERWLEELYGEEYRAYIKRVNRCIPWFYR